MDDLSWIDINLSAIDRNVAAMQRLLAPSDINAMAPGICAVIKKDAYGLGDLPIAQRLVQNGVQMLAVYTLAEADRLMSHGIQIPLLVLGPVHTFERTGSVYRGIDSGKLLLTVHSTEQLQDLNELGRRMGLRIGVHLYLDTGMSRAGIIPELAGQALTLAAELPHIQPRGVYTHFASARADADFTCEQLQRFKLLLDEHSDSVAPDAVLHAANSYAVLRGREHYFQMVRPGLALLGYGPQLMEDWPEEMPRPELHPAVRWVSQLQHVGTYPKGAGVGYGQMHKLKRDTQLGIVPVGYGDGYPLRLSNKSSVLLPANEQRPEAIACKVLGQISMDQIVIDLAQVPEGQLQRGDTVEIISPMADGPTALPTLAKQAKSSCYELLCSIGPRVTRRYVVDPALGSDSKSPATSEPSRGN